MLQAWLCAIHNMQAAVTCLVECERCGRLALQPHSHTIIRFRFDECICGQRLLLLHRGACTCSALPAVAGCCTFDTDKRWCCTCHNLCCTANNHRCSCSLCDQPGCPAHLHLPNGLQQLLNSPALVHMHLAAAAAILPLHNHAAAPRRNVCGTFCCCAAVIDAPLLC